MYAMGAQSIDCRRKVRIHGLRCAIHVLRKSILCTQYIHVDEPCQAVYIVLKHYLLIEKINTIHWDTILPPNIDAAWSTFSNIFVSIIHNYTPCQVIPSSPFPPRFPHSLIRKIHKRRHLYRQAVISQNPFIWSQYPTLRNSIVHDIRKAKSSYLCSLSISSRSFWSHVRSLRKSKGDHTRRNIVSGNSFRQ